MRINNNVAAMNTHRQYTINTNSVAKSTEKLSSGYRVNRAGDDAAGLAISEKMRSQIRGLNMASKNSSDAISLVQTAEGALQETHNILQRMRELAVQSSSDTNETSIDRAALNAEFQQLIAELDDTAKKTKFNDMGVIDGKYNETGGVMDAKDPAVSASGASFAIGSVFLTRSQSAIDNWKTANKPTTTDKTNTVGFAADAALNEDVFTFNGLSVAITADHFKAGSHTVTFSDGSSFTYQLREDVDPIASVDFKTAMGTIFQSAGIFFKDLDEGDSLTIQTGANQSDETKISLANMNAQSLGLRDNSTEGKTYSIENGKNARDAISLVTSAINLVSTERAKLGALQNRLNHKIQNLDTSAENLSAAESRIRDLDMAKEMTNFTRNQILTQASTSMLAQANVLPQGVLSLLG